MPLTSLSIQAGRVANKTKQNKTKKKTDKNKMTLPCHFYSLPHLTFSLHAQLLQSQPAPWMLMQLISFVPFKVSMMTRLEPTVLSPWRLLLFPFCQITLYSSALKILPSLVEHFFSLSRALLRAPVVKDCMCLSV